MTPSHGPKALTPSETLVLSSIPQCVSPLGASPADFSDVALPLSDPPVVDCLCAELRQLTRRARPIRIVNVLSQQEDDLLVACEDTISDIQVRLPFRVLSSPLAKMGYIRKH